MMGIRIANLDRGIPAFGNLLGWPYLPFSLVTFVPIVGRFVPLLDVLFIFRLDQRCLHDLLADAWVVKEDLGGA